MTQISLVIKDRALRDLVHDLNLAPKELKRIRRTAAWDTTKQVKTDASKRSREVLNTKKKTLDKNLHGVRVGDGGKFSVSEDKRLPLLEFGAKHKRSWGGARYKIERKKARTEAKSSFTIARWGGHVFKRVGKARGPLRRLKGVSLWGFFVKNNLVVPLAKAAEEKLYKNLVRRVKLEIFRRTGVVNTRNPFA